MKKTTVFLKAFSFFFVVQTTSFFIFPGDIHAYRTFRQHVTPKGQSFWSFASQVVGKAPLYEKARPQTRILAVNALKNLEIILNNFNSTMVAGRSYTTLSQQQVNDLTYQVTKYVTINGFTKITRADQLTKENAGYVLANPDKIPNWQILKKASETLKLLEIAETGWLEFQNHQYKKIWTGTKTWDEAENICIAEGAHLVSITSREENDFIDSLCGPGETCRLGHKSSAGYCTQSLPNWTNNEPFVYHNWAKGEPDFACQEDCLDMIDEGKWNNEWCDNHWQYEKYAICEK